MNLDRLRSETRVDHEETETAMPLMSDLLTRDAYAEVLTRLYQVVSSWETWATEHAPDDLKPIVQQRQRSAWLLQDLAWAHIRPEANPPAFSAQDIPGLDTNSPHFRSTFLGAMYVMEGSTLGGQYIARHLEEVLSLTPGAGDAYFRGYAEQTGEMWRAFKAVLADIPDEETASVIAAAKGMFRWFGRTMVGLQLQP